MTIRRFRRVARSHLGIGAAHRPPPTGKSVLRMEFGGRVKTLPYRAVTIPGGVGK